MGLLVAPPAALSEPHGELVQRLLERATSREAGSIDLDQELRVLRAEGADEGTLEMLEQMKEQVQRREAVEWQLLDLLDSPQGSHNSQVRALMYGLQLAEAEGAKPQLQERAREKIAELEELGSAIALSLSVGEEPGPEINMQEM